MLNHFCTQCINVKPLKQFFGDLVYIITIKHEAEIEKQVSVMQSYFLLIPPVL